MSSGTVGTRTWQACETCTHYDSEEGCGVPGNDNIHFDGTTVECDDYEKEVKEDE